MTMITYNTGSNTQCSVPGRYKYKKNRIKYQVGGYKKPHKDPSWIKKDPEMFRYNAVLLFSV